MELFINCRYESLLSIYRTMESYRKKIKFGLALKNEQGYCRGKGCRKHIAERSIIYVRKLELQEEKQGLR